MNWRPIIPLNMQYLADRLESAYESEKRFGELFTWFALVSILISCLGLFALSSFTTRSRIKEISIRKVHGATTLGMSLLLSSGLTGKVIIANLLAWPFAWYFVKGWLENFVFRTSPGLADFAACGTNCPGHSPGNSILAGLCNCKKKSCRNS
jgi:putative ABC transport system permease protein